MEIRVDEGCKLVDLEEFFIDKAREVFDLNEREELVKRVFQEVIGIAPHYVGTKKDPSRCNKYEKVFARFVIDYFHGPEDDDVEWILINENDEGKFYANFLEFRVEEMNPKLLFGFKRQDWWGRKTEDLVIEFEKEVEMYGLCWRIIVRIGLYKESE